jgi:predicted kinase
MKPQVILLVGPPLSGKDTYIRQNNLDRYTVISRDDILMSLSDTNDYLKAYKQANQKEVDRILRVKILENVEQKKDVIINMTNLTKKGRKKHLNKFQNYEKVAIVFPKLDLAEYGIRNIKRKTEENKCIPLSLMLSMISTWEEVTFDEGFDKIINL